MSNRGTVPRGKGTELDPYSRDAFSRKMRNLQLGRLSTNPRNSSSSTRGSPSSRDSSPQRDVPGTKALQSTRGAKQIAASLPPERTASGFLKFPFIKDARVRVRMGCRPKAPGTSARELKNILDDDEKTVPEIRKPGWRVDPTKDSFSSVFPAVLVRTVGLQFGADRILPNVLKWDEEMSSVLKELRKNARAPTWNEPGCYIEILFNVRNHQEHAMRMLRLFEAVLKFEWYFDQEQDKANQGHFVRQPGTLYPRKNWKECSDLGHLSLLEAFNSLEKHDLSDHRGITGLFRQISPLGNNQMALKYRWAPLNDEGERIRVYASRRLDQLSDLIDWIDFIFLFIAAATNCPKERLLSYPDSDHGLSEFLRKNMFSYAPFSSLNTDVICSSLDLHPRINTQNTLDEVVSSPEIWSHRIIPR